MSERVPLLILTGFLGAGKSTLLSQWVADPEFANAAVVINELGRLGIDPHLVGTATVVRAEEEGCICCTIRGALGTALEDLVLQRKHRRLPPFSRVIVETTGLARPGPILQEIAQNRLVSESYELEGIATAVDAVQGERQLDAWPESFEQAMVADALIVTKSDLAAPGDVERLERRLAALNPWTSLVRSTFGNADARRVLDGVRQAGGRDERRRHACARMGEGEGVGSPAKSLAGSHGADVRAVTIEPGSPMDPAALRSRLEAFLERHGDRVLRVKGLVPVAGQPGPAVIHAVAGVLYPVRLLARWPEGARGALVVITHGVPEEASRAVLEEVPA